MARTIFRTASKSELDIFTEDVNCESILMENCFQCVLSSLIVVALKSVIMQITELPQIWKLSFLDGLVWITTYLSVIFIEIDIGLLVGLVVSVLSLFIQGMKPHTAILSRVPGTDIYVDKSKYNQVRVTSCDFTMLK